MTKINLESLNYKISPTPTGKLLQINANNYQTRCHLNNSSSVQQATVEQNKQLTLVLVIGLTAVTKAHSMGLWEDIYLPLI